MTLIDNNLSRKRDYLIYQVLKSKTTYLGNLVILEKAVSIMDWSRVHNQVLLHLEGAQVTWQPEMVLHRQVWPQSKAQVE